MKNKNISIAKFMGWTKGKPNEFRWENDWFDKEGIRRTDGLGVILSFHTSWDWLMPVIEEIMNLSSDITPHEDAFEDYRSTIWNAVTNFDLESAHSVIVELIEWLLIID